MDVTAYMTLGIMAAMILALVTEIAGADVILFTALGILTLTGVISPKDAVAGFSNQGMITVALLFVVSEGIMQTGALNGVANLFLNSRENDRLPTLLLKMMIPVSMLSAFLNNTPIVVIFTPMVKKWVESLHLPASKFLIPLSYAAIFGGVCTLIGTSTNLVVHGLMLDNGFPGFTMFELGQVGLPLAVIGILYVAFAGSRLLPDRQNAFAVMGARRKEYLTEMLVSKACPLIGKSIRHGGLRNLKGLYLLEIERAGHAITAVAGSEIIRENDRLMFTGVTAAVAELHSIAGLIPVTQETFDADFFRLRNQLVEAVVSSTSPALGQTIKAYNFRACYDAAVVAVHRHGERINSKIGEIQLKAGDTLLLLTKDDFLTRWKHSEDFFLISSAQIVTPHAPHKTRLALIIMLVMVVGATVGDYLPAIGGVKPDMFYFALAAALLMLATRCVSEYDARQAINWQVLIMIAASFGISKALQNSGAASMVADGLIETLKVFGPIGVLAGVYLMTALFTEIITNNAAAALLFPIALAAAEHLQVNPKPFLVAITIAASASFSTPIGYQTNLIVQGAGGYRFLDYTRIGLPLSLLVGIVTIILVPLFWSF